MDVSSKLPENEDAPEVSGFPVLRRIGLAYASSFFSPAGPELTTTIAGFSSREPHR